MHRTDGDANVSNLFSDGDVSIPRPPTQVDKDWLNAVQEQLCNFITGRGITLVKGSNDQLTTALAAVTRVNATLASGWTGAASIYPVPRYYKDAVGVVHLEGSAAHSSDGAGVTMFTLPTGFRPASNFTCVVQQSDTSLCRLTIGSDGTVTPATLTGTGTAVGTNQVHIDNVAFHV